MSCFQVFELKRIISGKFEWTVIGIVIEAVNLYGLGCLGSTYRQTVDVYNSGREVLAPLAPTVSL